MKALGRLQALVFLVLMVGSCDRHPRATGEFLVGTVSGSYGTDVNRFVPDPVRQVRELEDHGDYYGFYTGAGHLDTNCTPPCEEHWQGLARLAHPTNARLYLLAVSSHSTEGRLAVIQNRDNSGLRLRGNQHSTRVQDWNTTPDPIRRIVGSETMKSEAGDTYLNHPGGMQGIGQYVAVGMERINDPVPGKVYLYDVSGMGRANTVPVKLWEVGILNQKIATASIVKLAPLVGETTSRYLMVTLGERSLEVTFNISRQGKRLDEADVFAAQGDTVAEGSITPGLLGVAGWTGGYQTMQILVDATGQLYLLGANKSEGGKDYLDIFSLRLRLSGGSNAEGNPHIAAELTHRANRTMYCIPSISGFGGCDFDAAGGAYIDPAGRLYFYATVHGDDDLNGSTGEWTRMMEFRPRDHLDEPGTPGMEGCPTLTRAWVTLYDKKLSEVSSSSSPVEASSFIIDYVDRRARAAAFFGFPPRKHYLASFKRAYNFNDRVETARYCIPQGHKFRLFEHENYRGAFQDLEGTDALNTLEWENAANRPRWSSGCFMDQLDRCL